MENSKKLNSFELISTTETLEFYSKNHLDMINVHRVLKNKLSLSGFHEHFKAVKKIGRGNFAIVNKKSQFILIFRLKVYMAHCNIDGQDYAVKAMNKLHLLKQQNGKVFYHFLVLKF